MMDQKTVRKLDQELEKAIAEVVIVRNKNWKYPLLAPLKCCWWSVPGSGYWKKNE